MRCSSNMAWLAASVLAALFVGAGCGGDGATIVPVRGRVTLAGQPVEGASVMLHPEGEGRPATGLTDASGEFQLTTVDEFDGAMLGDYRVTVSLVRPRGDVDYETAESGLDEMNLEYVVPQRYGDRDTSGLTAQVERGMSPLELELEP